MHNPRASTLQNPELYFKEFLLLTQVVEVYSSGGNFHLELPANTVESVKQLWEIPPYETRPLMKANFLAHVENNHTSFIRIKTNDTSQDYLVLPVEIEVSSSPGLYCLSEVLDFGLLTSSDTPKSLKLYVINSAQKSVQVQRMVVAPANDAVSIDFVPSKVKPDVLRPTHVATVTVDPSKVLSPKQWTGKVVIKSKNNQFKLAVSYRVQVIHGKLLYDTEQMRFFVGSQPVEGTRNLTVTNGFNVTVVIHNVSLPKEVQHYFLVENFKPVVLLPGQSVVLLRLSVNIQRIDANLQLSSSLNLHTNISAVSVPLLCYNGKLTKFIPPSGTTETVEFGTLGMGSKKDMFFTVINDNPIELRLKSWGSNLTRSVVELIGMEKGNASIIVNKHNFIDMAKTVYSQLTLKPYHYAVFRIGVTAPEVEGFTNGEAFVETQFEHLKLPFWLRTAEGSLTTVPEFVSFDNAFPGKVSVQKLYIYSSFRHLMIVTNVTAHPGDSRFYFKLAEKADTVVQPHVKSYIGRLYFDPQRECRTDCYSSFSSSVKVYQQWLEGLSLPSTVRDFDCALASKLYRRFQKAISASSSLNRTFQLDASEVHGFTFQAQATLKWPNILLKKQLVFPLTQIGNVTAQEFVIQNTATQPIIVQIVPMSAYPSGTQLPEHLQELNKVSETSSTAFSLYDLSGNLSDNLARLKQQKAESSLGIESHRDTIVFILQPSGKTKVKVNFMPSDEFPRGSMLFIRNNLTGLEVLHMRGRGEYGQFKLGNKRPNSTTPLLFELTEKHLRDCTRSKSSQFLPPNLTVKISFTARNVGEFPIYVQGFDVSGEQCEGYGFRILNCHGFELPINGSRKIDIAFTPDFTQSRIERLLQVRTSLWPVGILNYTLVATIPPHMLVVCSNSLPRPSWEALLYYIFVSFLVLFLIVIIAAAIFESERIIKSAFLMTTSVPTSASVGTAPLTNTYDKSKVLDLKTVKQKVENRLSKNSHISTKSKEVSHYLSGTKGKKPAYERQSSNEKEKKDWDTESETASSSTSSSLKAKKKGKSESLDPPPPPPKKGWLNIFPTENSEKNRKAVKSEANRRRSVGVPEESVVEHNRRSKKSKEKEEEHRKREKSSTEEETSSTTTEGSTSEEADRDTKRTEPKQNDIKEKQSSKSKETKKEKVVEPVNVAPVAPILSEVIETGPRARRERKSRLDSKFADGTINANSLELPYKPKHSKENIPERLRDRKRNESGGKKSARVKGIVQPIPVVTNGTIRASPTSFWDYPSKKSPDESYQEMAAQTENFALSSTSVVDSSACQVPTTYSNVVSYGDKRQARVTPMGKVLPEVRKTEIKHPGPVGQRPMMGKSIWGNDGDPWGRDDTMSYGGLRPGNNFADSNYHKAENFNFSPVAEANKFPMSMSGMGMKEQAYGNNLDNMWDSRSSYGQMIAEQQQLQNQRNIRGEWPGFSGMPSNTDLLWDPMYPMPQQPPNVDRSLWGTFVGGMSSVWPTSLWPNNNVPPSTAMPMSPSSAYVTTPPPPIGPPSSSSSPAPSNGDRADLSGTGSTLQEEAAASVPLENSTFDPFRSLSNIWSPAVSASSESWNTFFSSKEN